MNFGNQVVALVQPAGADIVGCFLGVGGIELRTAITTESLQACVTAIRRLGILARLPIKAHICPVSNDNWPERRAAELLAISAMAGDHPRLVYGGFDADGATMASACYINHLCHLVSPRLTST